MRLRLCIFLLGITMAQSLYAIDISGGGTNVLSAAVTANANTGADLVITDSATYTQSADLFIGLRYSGTFGRRAFNITAAPGQNPTIVLQAPGRIVMYAGSANARLGSNAGGKININATGNTSAPIWYIGQEDGSPAGEACQATLENLEITFAANSEGIVFGAGGNDAAPLTTSASLTLNNVIVRGGGIQLMSLYGPASYLSRVFINNSFLYNAAGTDAVNIDLGRFGLGGANSIINLSRTIVYNDVSVANGSDLNNIVTRLGQLNIDHSDILAENGGRAITTTAGNTAVTNSIVRGAVGTAAFGGTGSATDSNITGELVLNLNFTYTNCIEEWPVYYLIGQDPTNLDQFAVPPASLSRTHGSSPPLGSRGAASVPVELSGFDVM